MCIGANEFFSKSNFAVSSDSDPLQHGITEAERDKRIKRESNGKK